jgi:hypothetical protein
MTCEDCQGTGREPCTVCEGKGRIAGRGCCPDCTGRGSLACFSCEGTGEGLTDGNALRYGPPANATSNPKDADHDRS